MTAAAPTRRRGLEARRPQHVVGLLPCPAAVGNDPARRRRAHQGRQVWATPAGKPRLGRDGLQMRMQDGKTLWTPIVAFETKAISDRFSAQVIVALRGEFPNALPDPAAAQGETP